MTAEGALSVALRVEAGRVAEVAVASTRRTDVSEVLRGRSVPHALQLVPSLFALCGAAHTAAALEACEVALGVEVSEEQRAARRLVCALEAIDNHVFQLGAQWPALLGRPPEVAAVRRARAATGAVREWVFPLPRWADLGGVPGPARAPAAALAAALHEAVEALVPERALAVPGAWRGWAAQGEGPAAAVLRAVLAEGAGDFGAATAPLVPPLEAAWFGQRLGTAEFSARPTLDGAAAEAGAVALTQDDPVVAPLLSARTVVTRLVAKLVHLRRLVAEVTLATQSLRQAGAPGAVRQPPGRGVGIADTARGRLAHAVEVEAGRVVGWRTVAPTEWTFHPGGVLREALLGAPALDLQSRAGWLIAALDPCVPCTVQVRGA